MNSKSSLVMRRILKLEPKKRVQIHPRVEDEIVKAIEMYGYDLSNTVNIALEKHLTEKGVDFESVGGMG